MPKSSVKKLLGPLPALALPAILALAGCTSVASGDGERHPYRQGWRRATVLEVGPSEQIAWLAWRECRAVLPPAAPQTLYAKLAYSASAGSASKRIVVPVPQDMKLRIKDQVMVNPQDCSVPLARVIPAPGKD